MALEIERRFLVKSRLLPTLGEGRRIEQVYLSADPSVRVRLIDDAEAFITIKTEGGLVREEYEYPIPADDARDLMRLTPWSAIRKTRYKHRIDDLVWEIVCFDGDNAGLWSAEIELPSEDTAVALPPWLAVEVTEERRYGNANLARLPLASWPDRDQVVATVSS